MSDEGKRSEQVCVKMTERMYIDLGRVAALDERSMAEFIYVLLRRERIAHSRSRRHSVPPRGLASGR